MSRRYLPEPFNTPTEAHYAETTQRLYDNEREDQHRDALDDAAIHDHPRDHEDGPIMAAFRKVFGGES